MQIPLKHRAIGAFYLAEKGGKHGPEQGNGSQAPNSPHENTVLAGGDTACPCHYNDNTCPAPERDAPIMPIRSHATHFPAIWALGLVMALLCLQPAWANTSLDALEDRLFARTYQTEPDSTRLSRLETAVYGTTAPKLAVNTRVSRLEKSVGLSVQPIPASSQARSTANPVPNTAPDATAYPTISEMETRVFGKASPSEPVEARLSKLEQRVFGAAQSGELPDRSDRLSARILGNTLTTTELSQGAAGNAPSAFVSPAGPNAPMALSASGINTLGLLEQNALKKTYTQDAPDVRLDRLENTVFGSTAPEMTPDDRLARLSGVLGAQQSATQEQRASLFGTRSSAGYPMMRAGGRRSTTMDVTSMLLMLLLTAF